VVKIALVSPYDYPYPGGVTEHVRNLAGQFLARGHEVHVIAPSSSPASARLGGPIIHRVGRPVPVPANGSVARITLPLRGYVQVKQLLAFQGFDIVHLHEPMMPALPLTVLHHSPTINVGTFHAFGRSNMAYFHGKQVLKPFFNLLHGRIAVSGPARDFVGRHFPGEYRIIPNGIDYARFATRLEPPIERFEDDRLDVLFVGRLEKRKGLEHLLRAWPAVHAAVPQARLLVVGGGRRLDGYRRWVRSHGWSEVHFIGHVSPEDLVRYYQTSDVFCAPSTGQESFGIVLLEAMASGRPIVASRIPGYAEVLQDGSEGILVEPRSSSALAAGLVRLLGDAELRREMGSRGRAKAAAYDWSHVAVRVLDFYEETIDAHMEDQVRGTSRVAGAFRRVTFRAAPRGAQ
jgi:phosphatidylinositol alpha-mannosyltransferase